jgi:pyrroloquinoline-quinone synthase
VTADRPQPADAFVARLRAEGQARYHHLHPFNVAMHAGALTQRQIQGWVANRWYYQTRIPIKDAIILSKSDDPAFRRAWIRRIHDHDDEDGGLAQWLRLAAGVGLDVDEVRSMRLVLPGVRYACDAYVTLVRERTLVEAVASSLTEAFAPEIMQGRVLAWERHYAWVDPALLEYFRQRVPRARRDSEEAIAFVSQHASTRALEDACVAALADKCRILWSLLDVVASAYGAGE